MSPVSKVTLARPSSSAKAAARAVSSGTRFSPVTCAPGQSAAARSVRIPQPQPASRILALCSQVELFHRRILCRQAVQRRVLKGIVEHGAARKIISVFRGDLLIPPPEGLLLRLCKLCPQCFLHVFDFMNPECAQDVFKTALFCFHLVSYFQCARRSSSAPMSPVFPATASRSQCAIEGRPGSVVKK